MLLESPEGRARKSGRRPGWLCSERDLHPTPWHPRLSCVALGWWLTFSGLQSSIKGHNVCTVPGVCKSKTEQQKGRMDLQLFSG